MLERRIEGHDRKHPDHPQDNGAYVVGLPWLYTWGSGRFVGIGRDAEFVADHIMERSSASHADAYRADRRELSQDTAREAV